ncbi:MAG: hypothetical protein LBB83_04525 [Treponema sp.]|jgi:hypothetical protein|nr:hypothetical protein [Treponema sp.]
MFAAGSGIGFHDDSLGKRGPAACTTGKIRNLYGIAAFAFIENRWICKFQYLPIIPACFKMDLIITGAISPE